ncbi:trafficking protein particle complex subunit 10, TRAPPC10 [mine drainage metagenome]|uniref:Trafficking protein particle complex subunit 10, TRAPPC10 n=1 Tax=mine drainage metagenome TaxID=410659 RepID=A0A1J5RDN7_9ZZZZ
MVSLQRFLLICTLALLAATPALASLRAQVDRNPVAMDESFTLTLQSSDSGGEPDLDVLQRDFDVLGQSKSSSLQIINGQTSGSVQWQISLMPKRSGRLQIPAISVGSQSSQPIELTVSPASQTQAAPGGQLFLEVSAEPHVAYVQQQIIFTVRLYRTVDLGNGSSLSDPAFPKMDALVERLGGDRSFQTIRNGQTYSVIERRYAVYAQKSGQFSSAPVVFDGDVIAGGGGFFSFDPFGQNSRHLHLSSKTIDLSVKPMPAGASGSRWLPASKLLLTEQWSEQPPRFTVGEPITRTLTLTATGLTAAQLPALAGQPIAGLKLYPDQPALKDNPDDQGITGTRVQKIAIIPTRAGKLTLPAIEVKWWNVDADKEEAATLPARSITVLPGAPQAAAPPGVAPPLQVPTGATAGWWPWLSLSLALGWLATVLAWVWRAREKSRPGKPAVTEERLAQLKRRLKESCAANDAGAAQSQLLSWAKRRWPEQPPTSLAALARRCDPELAAALGELDRTLYSGVESNWRGEALWRRFSQHRPAGKEQRSEPGASLEALYRSP